MAARWMGWQTVAFCEKETYAQRVLKKHWPEVPLIKDIHELTEPIGCDIITGGFPCQPFSVAGKQKGKADDRHLWPQMARVVAQEKPSWVVGENVPGLIGLALDEVLFELESQDYSCWTFVLPACAVNAPHRRDRVWIVAHSRRKSEGSQTQPKWAPIHTPGCGSEVVAASNTTLAHSQGERLQRDTQGQVFRQPDISQQPWGGSKDKHGGWATEPPVGRVVNGLPRRVDRIKGLGNAIVPQLAYQIFKHIDELQGQRQTG